MKFATLLPIAAVVLALPAAAQEELFKLTASDGAANDRLGFSTSISGDRALVGAFYDDDSGSAYVFDVTTGQELHKLTPSDGALGDLFGGSVSISGDRAIVGAHLDDDSGFDSGSAYVFDVTTGQELFKLSASDGASFDSFGYSVSISGDRAIVGALFNDNGSGSVYVFDVTTGQELYKLTASDGSQGDEFGLSVSISGDRAIVGAYSDDGDSAFTGSAYVFDVTTGQELFKLTASDGASFDLFGCSVSIRGDRAVVGAFNDDDGGEDSGSAYVFDLTTGQELHKLTASDGAPYDNFGMSVSISGDHAVVGAYGDDDNGSLSGSAYIFDVANGHEIFKLTASDGASDDYFGWSVSISGDHAVVGAKYDDDNGTNSGSAYLFDATMSPLGTPFCFGDGTGTPCPCGNSGAAGEGCANDTGAGAVLIASGSNSVSADDLVLSSTGLTPGPGLYFQGNNAIHAGNGNPFGDGLRCVGGSIVRLEVRFSSGGAAQTTISVPTKGGVSAGDSKRYQLWYRDPDTSPCNSLFNLTNGYEITWTP